MRDELARPRVGVVIPGGEDGLSSAIAARVVTLAVLDRVPRARVCVLVSGGDVGAAPELDCGRPWRRVVAEDRVGLDVMVVVGAGPRVVGRAGGAACPVVRLPGGLVDVGLLAARAGGVELRRNRVETMRLLGWVPSDAGVAFFVSDDAAGGGVVLPPLAGVDEVVAAVCAAARYDGAHPMLAAIAVGVRDVSAGAARDLGGGEDPETSQPTLQEPPQLSGAGAGAPTPGDTPIGAESEGPQRTADQLDAAIDEAVRAGIECWHGRGSPGAIPDPRPTRRISAQHAALRVELRRLEREVEEANARTEQAETAADLITGSRTWRYTERVRGAYHAARGRLRR